MCRGGRLIDSGITAGILTKEKSRITYSFPKVRPHAPDTVQTPSRAGLSAWRRFQLFLWAVGARLRDHDVKYALKTGLATAALAAPAFIPQTRPTFMEYRGEWALISVSARFFFPGGVRGARRCVKVETVSLVLVLCRYVPHHRRGAFDLLSLVRTGSVISSVMMRRPISLACIAYLEHCERITLFYSSSFPPPSARALAVNAMIPTGSAR
jgi:hypothetical protein